MSTRIGSDSFGGAFRRLSKFVVFTCMILNGCCVSVVEGILPTAGIDVYFTDDYDYNQAKQAHAPIATLLASQASFGSDFLMGSSNNKPMTPVLPPQDDLLLCGQNYTNNDGNQIPYYSSTDILLVPRGDCSFELKTHNAQMLGAGAVIVYGTLGSRYSYNQTTSSIIYPESKLDYDCNVAQAQVDTSMLHLDGGYNASLNDYLMYGSSSLCAKANPSFQETCPSSACLLTGPPSNTSDIATACCAWDLHIWLYNDADYEKTLQDNSQPQVKIPALYVTLQQGQELKRLMSSSTGIVLVSYQRDRPKYNFSAVGVWALGVFVAWLASFLSASDYRYHFPSSKQSFPALSPPQQHQGGDDEERGNYTAPLSNREPPHSALMTELIPSPKKDRLTPGNESIIQDQSQVHQDSDVPVTSYAYGEETMELTWHHAVAFLVFSSTSLFVLFFFKIYALVKVMYGIGCSGALAQVVFIPLFEWVENKYSKRSNNRSPKVLFQCCGEPVTPVDFMAFLCGYGIGLVWIIIGFVKRPDPSSIPFYWITQDIFGACMCITFLGVIRLNSFKVATLLLGAAFFYDIFFVFITPYIFSKSIMITVATSGGPPTADPTYCEKYPSEAACQGGEPLPMLFTIPRLRDYQGGASMLGLGDIVLPGLLLSFACRLDCAKQLVGLASGGRGICSTPKACCFGCLNGYFYPVVVAYAVGLMMANAAVYIMEMGQPALLYLVPMCLGTMGWIAHCKGELSDLWERPKVLSAADRMVHGEEQNDHHSGNAPRAQERTVGQQLDCSAHATPTSSNITGSGQLT